MVDQAGGGEGCVAAAAGSRPHGGASPSSNAIQRYLQASRADDEQIGLCLLHRTQLKHPHDQSVTPGAYNYCYGGGRAWAA